MATLKRRLRRRGEGVPGGTTGEAAALDLSHQTLAKPETRRGSAETGWCEAAAWRSGARRPDGAAGREPKGAIVLPVFLVLAITDTEQQLRILTSKTPACRAFLPASTLSDTESVKRDYQSEIRKGENQEQTRAGWLV